jgi:hypothetical protein
VPDEAAQDHLHERRTMRTHEFWRERRTGHIWAVELEDGIVAACAGPLHPGDIDPEYLDGYDYSRAEAARLGAAREEFDLLDEEALLLLAASDD